MLDDEEISKLATCESEREIEKHDGELMQILAKWFDKPLSELPEKQRRHAGLYIKKWSELSPGERRACATEADRKIQQTIALRFQQARREQEGLPSDRFAQRAMQDGFDKATREKDGERDFESEIEEVNMLVERCMELARKEALTIADWIEITGIGRGKHGAYLVKRKSVSFIKWERSLIAGWPPSNQADMERENETAPLSFPCQPARLIQFIDTLPVEIHAFRVPDAFRQAVTEIVQATDATPQVPGNVLETTTANEAEQAATSTPATTQETPRTGAKAEIQRKRAAFINEFQGMWSKINGDLGDAARNGLALAANARHGFWRVGPALNWADERGRIKREKAEQFVRANRDSELSILIQAMLDRK